MKMLDEMPILSMESKDLLRRLKEIIREFVPSANVFLYGSFARGTQGPESDCDILVITDRVLSFDEQRAIRGAVFDVELPRGVVFSLVFCSKEEWEHSPLNGFPFHDNIEREAVIL